jgi:hypothetical protein
MLLFNSICHGNILICHFTLPGVMSSTSSLRNMVRLLGCNLVVEACQSPAVAFAEAPDEVLTAFCRQDGLEEALDSGFEEE